MSYLFFELFYWLLIIFVFGVVMGVYRPSKKEG